MGKGYQIVTRAAKESAALVEQFCERNGQLLLPVLNVIESASRQVESIIHEIGIETVETILKLSAEQVAGPRTPGKAKGEIRWHGSQRGQIELADRKLRLRRPRLRHRSQGEVNIPAYEMMQADRGRSGRMLDVLLRGVSTREYEEVLPKMAATVGVSRSAVSRQAIQASVEQLRQLQERRWEGVEILVVYIDGQRFGSHHVISAIGVDGQGQKHVLGIEAGATENAGAVKRLLTRLRDHGLPTDRRYLFVIDGAKALRAAIDEVFGAGQAIQRCRLHKIRNVLAEVPDEQKVQVANLMRASWKVGTAEEGEKKLEQLARFLEHEHQAAARSLREGLSELFTLQRLHIPVSLHRCLATTNFIEGPQGAIRRRTGKVSRWRDESMVLRWVASGWLLTEKHFKCINGHKDIWALSAILGRIEIASPASQKGVA